MNMYLVLEMVAYILLFLLLLNIRNILFTVTKNQAEIANGLSKGLSRIIKDIENKQE